MTVYVVTSGEYSDYGVNAIFSTKELAQIYMEKFSNPDRFSEFNDIQEWEVDDMEADLRSNRKPFRISMQRDGQVTYCESGSYFGTYNGTVLKFHDSLEISLFADDKDQAIKIANEKRLKYLLENDKKEV
jgi:hypothetical protein